MKHVFRKLTVLLLVLAILLSLLPSVFAAVGTLKPNSGIRDQVCTELSAKAKAYYTGTYSFESLAALAGASDTSTSYNAAQNNPLYTALNKLMTVTHTNQNVRYDGYAANSLATYWAQTDTENSASTYLYFYTDILADDPTVSSMTMNREHVWPKSRASYYQKGGGSDLHHLRPSIQGVNASKSNNAFANLNGSGSGYQVNGRDVIWTGSKDGVGGVLEVRDNVKGDVARILLYVYVRWQQPNLYSDVAASLLPEMDPDDSQNTGGRAIESLSTLLQWMQKDPVDTWEMSRNDQIENVQGNRNVFIDYPELAYLMFSQPIPKMTTPSGIAAGTTPTTQTDPTTAPTEPTTAPTQPTAAPTEPTTSPTEPTAPTAPHGDEYALTTTLKDGDEVVIYNAAAGKAMSEDAVSIDYRAGVSTQVLNYNVYTDDSKIVWTVGRTEDGYTFKNDSGETLSATKGLSFASTDNVWAISPAATANSVYLVSTTAKGTTGDPKSIEWYGRYNEFSTYYYSASLESDFALQLFVKTGNVAPTEPTTAPTEPTTAPTQPTVAPTQPTTAPTQPTTAPTQPTTAPTQPTTAPTQPTAAPDGSFVLSSSIKGGDQVVIYNPSHGMAIKDENDNNWYLVPQAITPANNKIYDPDAALIWTVVDNGNGTYSFTNGSHKIVCWVSGNYFELTNDASYSGADGNWKVTWTNGLAYIQHATFSNSYGPAYIECYYNASKDKTNISGYSTSDPTAKSNDFGFQFFVKTGSTTPTEPTTEPTTAPTQPTVAPTQPTTAPTQPTVAPTQPTTAPTQPTTAPDGSFVLSSSIKSGDQVVIYNPGHGMAIKDENDNNWYLVPQAITPTNNKIYDPDAALIWTVVDNGNGTYSFTNGSHKIVCWVSGNYFELTNDASYSGADGNWKVSFTDGLAYIQHATFSNSYGPAYIECYYNASKDKTNISGYSTSNPTAKSNDFGFQFFVKTGSTTPTEPTTAPTQPTVAPTEPTTAPTQPTVAPTQPTTAPTQPTTPSDPSQIYYTITWYVDGKAYREQCAKGETPVFSGSTDKPADEEYTYTFAGWSPIPVPAYADATYIATYTKEPIRPEGAYLITWIVNGKETTLRYEAGVMPVFTGSTDRPDDENFIYCFAGWSPAVEKVTKNATYTAQYNRIPLHKVEDFVDVPKEMWCYEEVHRAAQIGLFNGMSYLHFEPNGDVSRAMIVTVLYRMEGEPEVKMARTFSDVPTDRWYSDAVLWAYENGIAKGVSDNLFAPNAPVTREQLAAFLYRYAQWKDYDVSGRGKLTVFADNASISDYARAALSWAVDSDMLRGMQQNGRLCLAPQGTATRAQAASIMVRFFNAFIK